MKKVIFLTSLLISFGLEASVDYKSVNNVANKKLVVADDEYPDLVTSFKLFSSGYVGCAPNEVFISDIQTNEDKDRMSFLAQCKSDSFRCFYRQQHDWGFIGNCSLMRK